MINKKNPAYVSEKYNNTKINKYNINMIYVCQNILF